MSKSINRVCFIRFYGNEFYKTYNLFSQSFRIFGFYMRMSQLDEQVYCVQQINVPPTLPFILKSYAKAAIKTQPYDLLRWSAEYFRALAEGRLPPVKLRLEYPLYNTDGGLSFGYLRMLIKEFTKCSDGRKIPKTMLEARWKGICLQLCELDRILCLAGSYNTDNIDVLQFAGVAAGHLKKSLTQTMILVCELLTREPDGGNAGISYGDFVHIYKFLAPLDASKEYTYINGLREGTEVVNSTLSTGDTHQDSNDTYTCVQNNPVVPILNISSETEASTTDTKVDVLHLNLNSGAIDDSRSDNETLDNTGEFEPSAGLNSTANELLDSTAGETKRNSEGSTKTKSNTENSSMSEALQKITIETVVDSSEKESVEKVITVYPVAGIGAPVDEDVAREFLKYASDLAGKQEGIIMPRNIRHFLCPPLESEHSTL